MRKVLLFFLLSMLTITITHAQPTYTSGISLTNCTSEISTDIVYDGVQSLKIIGDGVTGSNPDFNIDVREITDWATITKVTYWAYSTKASGGHYYNNGQNVGYNQYTYTAPTIDTWTLMTFDFSDKPFSVDDTWWAQIGFQLYTVDEVIYIDEFTFYNSSDEVVYEIDASDVNIEPTSITVTPNPINAIVGKKQQLSVAVDPTDANTSVSYASDDPSVSVASSGEVTMVSAGSASVTATSNLATSISGSTAVTVENPNEANTLTYENFENGFNTLQYTYSSWNNDGYSGAAPAVTVVDNPLITGNSSSKVLQIADCYQWGGVQFKYADVNKINTIKFKAYSPVAIADMSFQIGLENSSSGNVNTAVTALPADTWTEYAFDVTYLEEGYDEYLFIKNAANSSQEATSGTAYTLYIDDIVFVAGDGSTYKPVTAVNITSASTITEDDGTLALAASITPIDATNQDLVWSILEAEDAVDTVIFDATAGTIQAVRNGEVTVRATTTDGGYISEQTITITGQVVPAETFDIEGADISTNGGTSQMDTVLTTPEDADLDIEWGLETADDSVLATISATGLVTAYANGTLTVIATDKTSGLTASVDIEITNQVLVNKINVTTEGGVTAITENAGTLQATAEVLPADARIKEVVWSIESAGGQATVSDAGLIKASADGNVVVKATAIDASGVSGSVTISISGQVAVENVVLGVDTAYIDEDGGTLKLPVNVSPDNASDTSVVWTISDEEIASIDETTGLISALRNGTVSVVATAFANPALKDTAVVIITNQTFTPTAISISGEGDKSTIDVNGGTLALTATVTPSDAIADVIWSILEDAGIATISETGLVTAIADGEVLVQASSTVAPVAGEFTVTITNQIIEPTAIAVTGTDGATAITEKDGTLQMIATVTPDDADASVVWSLAATDTAATISETGLLTAKANGTVTVTATSTVDESVSGVLEITISGQEEAEDILVTSIEVFAENLETSIDEKAGTLQMSATVEPANATDKTVAWSSGDDAIATVSETGLVTAVADGKVTITATANDASGVTGSIELTITNQGDGINGNLALNLNVYPNPVNNQLFIKNLDNADLVELVSTDGKVTNVTSEFVQNNSINVQNLESGLYIIRAVSGTNNYKALFIKQ